MATIYALSTKLGRAAIGVIRVLGPHLEYVFRRLTNQLPSKPRILSVRRVYDRDQRMLDEALTIFFKAPHSYTGEDSLELHVHGGTAIISLVLKAIGQIHEPGNSVEIRYAEPGEFSRRAFINGRFDLTEIEGVRLMIDAETETQRRAAVTGMRGDSRTTFNQWRQTLIEQIALLTTVIDFGEDHGLDEVAELFDRVGSNLDTLESNIDEYLQRAQRAQVLLNGITVVLIGPPNAGKLTLLNKLSDSDTAIVSDTPGTTRDVLKVPLDIGGYKVIVGDTAGIRPSTNAIELEGINRAKSQSEAGDLVVVVLPVNQKLEDLDELRDHLKGIDSNKVIVVVNKMDLVSSDLGITAKFADALGIFETSVYLVSCSTDSGIQSLNEQLINRFEVMTTDERAEPIALSQRAQDVVQHDVLHGIKQFRHFKLDDDVVLATEALRQSVEGIGKITGEAVGVEEILGVVFSSFCIGK